MEFLNKTAVISGAGFGMGLLLSKEFAKLGGNVVLVDVNKEAVEAVAAEINREIKGDGAASAEPEHPGRAAIGSDYSGRAVYAVCDVRNYEEVAAACAHAVKTFGAIDFVVNLAGGAETRILKAQGEFADVPIEVFDWGIDVNLKGQMYFCHAAMKYMREQKNGVIINIGSITGEEGSEVCVAYSAAKSGAMGGLTKSIAMYGSQYGVRCVCVSPGPVLTRDSMAGMKTVMGRAGEPSEIVDVILFLMSDKASFITGTNILVDGGRNVVYRR